MKNVCKILVSPIVFKFIGMNPENMIAKAVLYFELGIYLDSQ